MANADGSMNSDDEHICPELLYKRVIWPNDQGMEPGVVRWLGKLPEFGTDIIAGVVLENPVGHMDGYWNAEQLFVCKENYGLLISVNGLLLEDTLVASVTDEAHVLPTPQLKQQILLDDDSEELFPSIPDHQHRSQAVQCQTETDITSQNVIDKETQTDLPLLSYCVESADAWLRPSLQMSVDTAILKTALKNGKEQEPTVVEVLQLLKGLELAIMFGKKRMATRIVTRLCEMHTHCFISCNNSDHLWEQERIYISLYVEDTSRSLGPLSLKVNPSMTVGQLKTKMNKEFSIPEKLQKWIVGKELLHDDNSKLSEVGVDRDGVSLFLYLVPESAASQSQEFDMLDNIDNDVPLPEIVIPTHLNSQELSSLSSESQLDNSVDISESREMQTFSGPNLVRSKADEHQTRHSSPVAGPSNAVAKSSNGYVHDTVFSGTEREIARKKTKFSEKVEGWECPKCMFLNVPTRPGCEFCTEARPENYVVPFGYQPPPSELARLQHEKEAERAIQEYEQEQNRMDLGNYQQLLILDDQEYACNEVAFECLICMADIPPLEGVVLKECLHMFCRDCIANQIKYCDDPRVPCPYVDGEIRCLYYIQEREIRSLVTEEVYDKYLERGVKLAENSTPNSFHCKTPDCRGWCVYEDEVNQFMCPVCENVNCLTCQAIHEGINCHEYQEKLEMESATDENMKKSLDCLKEMLESNDAMRCPTCRVILMKKVGCDWLQCTMCKTQICWVTRGPRWGPKGAGDLSGGCRCRANGRPCHPECGNCH